MSLKIAFFKSLPYLAGVHDCIPCSDAHMYLVHVWLTLNIHAETYSYHISCCCTYVCPFLHPAENKVCGQYVAFNGINFIKIYYIICHSDVLVETKNSICIFYENEFAIQTCKCNREAYKCLYHKNAEINKLYESGIWIVTVNHTTSRKLEFSELTALWEWVKFILIEKDSRLHAT